jgi:hypothetical protein
MPIGIQVPALAEAAYLIDQQWTVRSLKRRRIGTINMFNCMGVVVHSPSAGIGCLAHIEAEDYATYGATFNTFITYMVGKIRKYGGAAPTFQAALFGNANGSSNQAFSNAIHAHMLAAGIPHAEILDNRNHVGGGAHYNIGAIARTEQTFGSITYRPGAGDGVVLCFGPYGAQPGHASSCIDWGIRKKRLQGV